MQARIFTIAVMLLFPVPILLWWSMYYRKRMEHLSTAGVLLLTAALLLALVYSQSSTGISIPGSGVQSHFTGNASFNRMSPANLVPEIDQLKLATYVLPYMDPIIDRLGAMHVRNVFLKIYREMDKSPEFECLGSVLGYAYRDIFLKSRPAGHFYEYVPKTEHSDPLPAIIFLHGSLGNFKGYLWVWKSFADKNGFAFFAPTFGTGDWDLNGGVETVERMRQYCLGRSDIDGRRIYLAGLSNGGMGVTRTAEKYPSAYAGLVFISAVIEPEIISGDSFIAGWKGRSVLVLHGSKDDRISARSISDSVDLLRKNGVNVKNKSYPYEDHFMMFSWWHVVSKDIAEWIRQEQNRDEAPKGEPPK